MDYPLPLVINAVLDFRLGFVIRVFRDSDKMARR